MASYVGRVFRQGNYFQQWKLISRRMSSLTEEFEKAKNNLGTLTKDPGNDAKLKLYGLFKQGTQGKCNIPKPGILDMVGRAKWDAWNSLGDLSKEDAQKKYIATVKELSETLSSTEKVLPPGQYETVLLSQDRNIRTVVLNRPEKKNAISYKMYEELMKIFNEAKDDESVSALVLTGAGNFYSAGNDLSNFTSVASGPINEIAEKAGDILNDFVSCFIDCPKLLIAAVNGPAVGIPVTTLGLCDIVYASDKATFHTPFSLLGQAPEACSTYVFPKLMGKLKANEMLMLNRKLTAAEACSRGLVTEVFPDDQFQAQLKLRLEDINTLPKMSLISAKELYQKFEKEKLHKVNDDECRNLVIRWQSEECMNAIMKFLTKSKR